ncbi:MAG: type I 3-dehydroquinate dehydratase [Clostridiales bacterium]|nr:type I 3-dehydroquinate dehydratase [Clostridiales bacterium]
METLKIRDVTLGAGIPKICIPIVGHDLESIVDEAKSILKFDPDFVEWRADYFEHAENVELVTEILKKIRATIIETPLIFTFRNEIEGGVRTISEDYYFQLNTTLALTGKTDIIDLELSHNEQHLKNTILKAHKAGVTVILSSHNIDCTPPKSYIIDTFNKMQSMGADIPKIAVMANKVSDVLTLLDATNTIKNRYAKGPFITISMGNIGLLTRLCGELFGSSMTFASGREASAPGQINPEDLKKILLILHERSNNEGDN